MTFAIIPTEAMSVFNSYFEALLLSPFLKQHVLHGKMPFSLDYEMEMRSYIKANLGKQTEVKTSPVESR